MVKTTKPYEDYFKNVVKPKVLKGEEDTLDNKWKRLVPTAYREIIKEQQDKIDRTIHRIQLLQMDGEVSIKDLGLIVRDLQGSDE